jgi:hypothetical protein
MTTPYLPSPSTWTTDEVVKAPVLRSDVSGTVQLLASPPLYIGNQTITGQPVPSGTPTAIEMDTDYADTFSGHLAGGATPYAFTATDASPCVFTATGSAYVAGTAVQLAGGSLPGGFFTATTYYVVSPVTDTFELAATPDGDAIDSTSTGSGTVTEVLTGNPQDYYGMFPGWYIAEAQASLNYTSGSVAGAVGTGIGFSSAGGAVTAYLGPQAPPKASTVVTAPSVAKLVKMSNTGTQGGAANDYVQALAYQTTGASYNLSTTASAPSYLTVRWACALTGTRPLPVPANPSWPSPPDYLTSAFLNANVRDACEFLLYPPVMEYSLAGSGHTLASQSSLPAAGTSLPLDTATVDNYAAFASPSWTAPVAGLYWCYGQVAFTTLATTVSAAAGLTITSANYNSGTAFTYWPAAQVPQSGASRTACFAVRRRLRLNAGDTLELAGFQHDSGANAVTLLGPGTTQCRMIVCWLPR